MPDEKMPAETLEALKRSIAHWERIVAGTEPSRYGGNCALCQTFVSDNCEGCPVAERTGVSDCRDTPFYDFTDVATHRDGTHGDGFNAELWATNDEAKAAAEAELDFLRSLLPEGERR